MKRRQLLAFAAGAGLLAAPVVRAAPKLPPIEVFKNPSCGCCGVWADHLKAAGFAVKQTPVADTAEVRRRVGMPERFGSCHTAMVAGYAVEGHVPADDIKRLLALKPQAIGLAVPGMPVGSPGMEVGDRQDPYKVILIDKRGHDTVFASYPKA